MLAAPFSRRLLIVFLLLCCALPNVFADDEPADLVQSRTAYQKEIEFATRPIRDRYISRLETLKRTLGARGDARGSVAVQDEIDRLKAASGDAQGIAKFAGTWLVKYGAAGNYTRRYVIKTDGAVLWDMEDNKPFSRKGKIIQRASDFVLEIEGGGLERVTVAGRTIVLEQFHTLADVGKGAPENRGTGALVAPAAR